MRQLARFLYPTRYTKWLISSQEDLCLEGQWVGAWGISPLVDLNWQLPFFQHVSCSQTSLCPPCLSTVAPVITRRTLATMYCQIVSQVIFIRLAHLLKPCQSLDLGSFNMRTLMQTGQQPCLALTVESLSIIACCISERLTQGWVV